MWKRTLYCEFCPNHKATHGPGRYPRHSLLILLLDKPSKYKLRPPMHVFNRMFPQQICYLTDIKFVWCIKGLKVPHIPCLFV